MALRLNPAVSRDFAELYSYGAVNFGLERAAKYVLGLREKLGFIVEFPEAVPERSDTRPPVRLYRHESHLIIYRIDDGDVVVLRILHYRSNWKDHL